MNIQFNTSDIVISGDDGRVTLTLGKREGGCSGKQYYVASTGTQAPAEKEFSYPGQAIAYLATQVSQLWARESVREFAKLPTAKKQQLLIQILTGEI